jgi:hypothetical protein
VKQQIATAKKLKADADKVIADQITRDKADWVNLKVVFVTAVLASSWVLLSDAAMGSSAITSGRLWSTLIPFVGLLVATTRASDVATWVGFSPDDVVIGKTFLYYVVVGVNLLTVKRDWDAYRLGGRPPAQQRSGTTENNTTAASNASSSSTQSTTTTVPPRVHVGASAPPADDLSVDHKSAPAADVKPSSVSSWFGFQAKPASQQPVAAAASKLQQQQKTTTLNSQQQQRPAQSQIEGSRQPYTDPNHPGYIIYPTHQSW